MEFFSPDEWTLVFLSQTKKYIKDFKRYLVYLKYVWTVKQRMFIIPLLSFILNASFYVIVLFAAKTDMNLSKGELFF